jgi:hypothetical protein
MKDNRYALLLCLGVFSTLTILAMRFYQERIINLDMAFQAFLILKSGSLEIQSGRFGAAVTQVWPWVAQAMGLPLKGVLFEGLGQQFYMENLYLPLGVFASIPLVFDVLSDSIKNDRLVLNGAVVLVILSGLNLFRIGAAHRQWAEKLQWEKDFLAETATLPNRKIVLTERQAPMETLKMSWGSSFECLMLSALVHPDSSRCLIIHESPERFDSLLTRPRLFFGAFKNYPFQELPDAYFNFQDTSNYVRWDVK